MNAAPVTAATPGQADASNWWVCDGALPPHGTGQKITGPFATQELALTVRAYVEKAEGRTDLWVDDDAREPHAADVTTVTRLGYALAALQQVVSSTFEGTPAGDAARHALSADELIRDRSPQPEPQPAPELAVAMADLGTARRPPGEARAELATLRALHAVTAGFATEWAGLFTTLPDDYGCEMTCAEANAAADLYRALGDDATAQAIITAHAEHDDDEERTSHQEDQ